MTLKRKRHRLQPIDNTDDKNPFQLTNYDDCKHIIGRGRFAVVCMMTDRRTKEARAVKVMTMTASNSNLERIKSERILQEMHHPNVQPNAILV